jgi:hypothetical protein
MSRRTVLRSALLFLVAVPISFLLGAVSDGFATRHHLHTPGLLVWRLSHPVGSTNADTEGYLSGLWTTMLIDGLCWMILLTLVSVGMYAITRTHRRRSGRAGQDPKA